MTQITVLRSTISGHVVAGEAGTECARHGGVGQAGGARTSAESVAQLLRVG